VLEEVIIHCSRDSKVRRDYAEAKLCVTPEGHDGVFIGDILGFARTAEQAVHTSPIPMSIQMEIFLRSGS
jgi:hypothetical protein